MLQSWLFGSSPPPPKITWFSQSICYKCMYSDLHFPDNSHSTTATAEGCFENYRQSVISAKLNCLFSSCDRSVCSRNDWHLCNFHK